MVHVDVHVKYRSTAGHFPTDIYMDM